MPHDDLVSNNLKTQTIVLYLALCDSGGGH